MKALAVFTLKSLRANRVRTLVTIGGVALAAALLAAILTSFTSLNGFLYDSEKEVAGSWMAEAHGSDASQMKEQIAFAAEEPDVVGIASLQDVGFGELTAAQRNVLGRYVPIAAYEGDVAELCAITPSEGRLPSSPDEIMLPSLWKAHGYAAIGDEITITVGQRQAAHASEEAPAFAEYSPSMAAAGIEGESDRMQEVTEGTRLDSTMGYLEAKEDGGSFNEELVDLQPKTFTVVGFSSPYVYALSVGVGQTAVIGNDPALSGPISAYVAFNDVHNTDQVEARAEQLFPNEDITYHTAMLRYLGVQGNSPIWDTFFGIVILLSVVIVIACVSLIYNTFAISVAERRSQFGLLASIGASQRQLRRAVLIEGLCVALVGIPLGLLIGLGGCAITFWFLGPMISSVLSDGRLPFTMTIAPWALGIAAGLTLATVLISAFIPAWSVGHTSPIAALKQNKDGKISTRGSRDAARSIDAHKLWKAHGLLPRAFGTGGLIASINAKRSKAKGRAASLSLAIAIVLLMTAGSLDAYLGTLVDAVDVSANYDIGVSAQLDHKAISNEDGVTFYEGAYEAMASAPDVQAKGWLLGDTIPLILPADMVGSSFASQDSGHNNGGLRADGTFGTMGALYYLEDDAFDAYARQAGVDPKDFYDPAAPQVIAANRAYAYFDGKYQQTEPLSQPGTALALLPGEYRGQRVDGYSLYAWEDLSGEGHFEFMPYRFSEDDAATDLLDNSLDKAGGMRETLVVDELPTQEVRISCLSAQTPDLVPDHIESIQLIAPLSQAEAGALPQANPIFAAGFDATGPDHAAAAEAIEERFDEFRDANEPLGQELVFSSVNDYLSQTESMQMIALIVKVFCLLFTAILTLIALANVFNTMTNGLILRRREFAVMRSIGLSNRQFRCLIAEECVSYGLRGLLPGLVVSLAISYGLYAIVGLSLGGVAFTVPWGYLGLAIALTLTAMAISVAYGMHRCKADNVVEALRADSV